MNEDFTSRLPEDVLVAVFQWLVPTDFTVNNTRDFNSSDWISYFHGLHPIHITAVCRRWRTTALSASFLWSEWYITLSRPTLNAVRMMEQFITRALRWSGDAVLTSTLYVLGSHSQDYPDLQGIRDCVWKVVSWLFEARRRWKSINLSISDSYGDPQMHLRLSAQEFPSLEALSLVSPFKYICEEKSDANPYTLQSFPNLRQFCIHQTRVDHINSNDIIQFIGDRVEDLGFITIDPDSSNHLLPRAEDDLRPPIVKRRLSTLNISFLATRVTADSTLGSNISLLNNPIRRLTCPSLKFATLVGIVSSSLNLFAELLHRSASPLLTLLHIIVGNDVSEDNVNNGLVAVLQQSPTLTSLTIISLSPIGRFPLTTTLIALSACVRDKFSLVPGLERLLLGRLSAPSSVVIELVKSRRRPVFPSLGTVQIINCGETSDYSTPYPTFMGISQSPESLPGLGNWKELEEYASKDFVLEVLPAVLLDATNDSDAIALQEHFDITVVDVHPERHD